MKKTLKDLNKSGKHPTNAYDDDLHNPIVLIKKLTERVDLLEEKLLEESKKNFILDTHIKNIFELLYWNNIDW